MMYMPYVMQPFEMLVYMVHMLTVLVTVMLVIEFMKGLWK